jgi:hypothetical protein
VSEPANQGFVLRSRIGTWPVPGNFRPDRRAPNKRLVASVNQWRDVITAQRGWPLGERRDLSALHDEHERIVRAARDHDPYAAAQAMHQHLLRTGTRALTVISAQLIGTSTVSYHQPSCSDRTASRRP